ncbi:MAG: XisI protein [Chloroflexota bacterium]
MARVDEYAECVQGYLKQYASTKHSIQQIETQTIFDTEHHHYQLMNVGWIDNRRVYGSVLHIDIKDDKVWIQHNGTELPVAEELVALAAVRSVSSAKAVAERRQPRWR